MKIILLFLCIIFCPFIVKAQNISGYIYNDQNEPIPYVNIYIQELQTGTTTDTNGKYFLTLLPGNYRMVVSAVGYESIQLNIEMGDVPIVKDIQLKISDTELNEITIKADKRDPAYEIIKNVIENKKKYLGKINSYKTNIYVKAVEEIETIEKKEKKEVVTIEAGPVDPFENANNSKSENNNINMVEMQLTLNYLSSNKIKEERTAVKRYGNQDGLYIPKLSEADFNFYENLVYLNDVAQNPLISPVSRTAILSYKYKLLSAEMEGEQLVYKIKVAPRKKGNSTVSGLLFINDSSWTINRLDLSFPKGGLKFYDKFSINQTYTNISDTLWLATRQAFTYETKEGKRKKFKGSTVLNYSNYQIGYVFPPKFFGNEVAVTTQEAYDKDSTFWKLNRPEPLTVKQQKMVFYRDSLEAAHNDPVYLDSLDKAFNKITLSEMLLLGVSFQNTQKKRRIYVGSLLELVNFEVIGGFRVGPYVNYFKRWKDERFISINGSGSFGFRNKDVIGNSFLTYRYNPFKLGDIYLRGGRSFFSINSFDAYLNQLRASNYILNDNFGITHRIELFNGFYVATAFDYRNRKSLENIDTRSIINEVIDEVPPIEFENYQAFITQTSISYTPKQRYMREPKRKVVLGSAFPTFTVFHRKGWDGPFSSDISFDFLGLTVDQDVILGTLGSAKYNFEVGKFITSEDLRLVDLKRFRQSDPILYSDPLRSFQLLDTALATTDLFYEAHFIHHFNGALVNNLPLIKKTRISLVAGAGAMWLRENNFRYTEIFGGIERVFKLGARRRLRLGVYGVLAESNQNSITSNFKISFDIIDTWKKDWSY